MRAWLRKSWPVLKALLAMAILVAIGRQFARDLANPGFWQRPLRFDWLAFSGLFYVMGLGWAALYWYSLLRNLGQRPTLPAAVRAHFMGQMGKYLPGKAWALVLRASLVRGCGVRVGIAVLTSFYEVLVIMAAGALFAACSFALQIPDLTTAPVWGDFRRLLPHQEPSTVPIDPKVFVLLGLLLALVIGIPILPPCFNRLVRRMALPFREADAAPIPRVGWRSFFQGCILTIGCWLLMGASLWAILQAVMNEPPLWSVETWWRHSAFIALAYVAGFVIVVLPSGLGAREFILVLCLLPEVGSLQGLGDAEARSTAELAVLSLRVVWTAAELVMVGLVYWLPSGMTAQPRSPDP